MTSLRYQGYLRCPAKYQKHLLDTLQKRDIAVDEGVPLPWGIGAILFPSLASTNPEYICEAFLIVDVVLGEENAIKSALIQAHSANAQQVRCMSDCSAMVEYIHGNR
ncbi:hypothetical protein DM860_004389 [Cuscuta australis]|uniref:RNase H type-1 domain-containing protein n=1 Tax=Cuscuta australis TaxID=267555 RepID=A0A328EB55_9ASTE|nr:hypothetical protein DM860_004389 [Cuscuta australis]